MTADIDNNNDDDRQRQPRWKTVTTESSNDNDRSRRAILPHHPLSNHAPPLPLSESPCHGAAKQGVMSAGKMEEEESDLPVAPI